jgi:hypothetical protein
MQVNGPVNGMDKETRRWRELTYVFKGVQSRLSRARGGVIEVDKYAITLQCAQTT